MAAMSCPQQVQQGCTQRATKFQTVAHHAEATQPRLPSSCADPAQCWNAGKLPCRAALHALCSKAIPPGLLMSILAAHAACLCCRDAEQLTLRLESFCSRPLSSLSSVLLPPPGGPISSVSRPCRGPTDLARAEFAGEKGLRHQQHQVSRQRAHRSGSHVHKELQHIWEPRAR